MHGLDPPSMSRGPAPRPSAGGGAAAGAPSAGARGSHPALFMPRARRPAPSEGAYSKVALEKAARLTTPSVFFGGTYTNGAKAVTLFFASWAGYQSSPPP